MIDIIKLVVVVFGILLLGLCLARRFGGEDGRTIPGAIKVLQDFLTVVAILLGGYWYFVERKGQPHADLTQAVAVVPADRRNGLAIVEATLSIKNIGDDLLTIRDIDIRLQSTRFPAGEVAYVTGLNRGEWPQQILGGFSVFNDAELQYPVLRRFHGRVDHEIEPGETDTITTTFLVPCTFREMRVASYVTKNEVVAPWNKASPLVWETKSFVSLKDACTAK